MKKYLLFLFFIAIYFSHAQSGPNFLNLIKSSTSGNYWEPLSTYKLANGNYLIGANNWAGMTVPGGGLISTNSLGNIVWYKAYQSFSPQFIEENGSNIFILYSNTGKGGPGISKHSNSTGNIIFSKTFSNSNPNFTTGITPVKLFKEGTNNAMFYYRQYTSGGWAGLLTKFDANGNSVFSKRMDSLFITDAIPYNGDYILLALKDNTTFKNYYLIRTDANLNIIWSKEFDFTQTYYFGNLTNQNNVIYFSATDYNNNGALMGVDGSGNIVLNKSYYAPAVNGFQPGQIVYKSNKLYLFFWIYSNGGYYYSGLTTLDMNGVPQKNRMLRWATSSYYNWSSVLVNSDTSVYRAGIFESSPTVLEALQSHFNLNGDLETCTPDSISILDSSLTVTVAVPPSFTVTNEAIVFTNNPLIALSEIPSIEPLKIKVDSLSRIQPTCSSTCSGSETVYYSGYDLNPSFLWSVNSGSQTTQGAVNLCADVYSVTVTDQFGCTATGSDTLKLTPPPTQDICLVTVDSTSTKNVIAWEKPTPQGEIDSFLVYREIGLNNYVHIASVPYSALSEFTDTTNGVNPQIQSYRYKLSVRDTCGTESVLSAHHRTIHLSTPTFTPPKKFDLIWTNDYEGFSFSQYYILRDGNNTGNWVVIDSVTYGNLSYTDINAPSDSARYLVEATPTIPCIVSTKNPVPNASTIKSSKSNTSEKTAGTLSVTITFTNVTCNGQNNGTATANASGGLTPYSYLWSAGNQTTQSISGLSPGNYSVTVTDATPAIKTATVAVSQPAAITISTTNSVSICAGNCATLTASASGGNGGFMYQWQPSGATTSSIIVCSTISSTYTVTAIDSKGCSAIAKSNILVNNLPVITASVNPSSTICQGFCATLNSSGASTYVWSPPSCLSSITGNVIISCCTSSITYTVTGTDANGCSNTATANVNVSPAISDSLYFYGPICGNNDGYATATATGGTLPYTYSWSNGATTSSVTGLTGIPGGYLVITIYDAAGCKFIDSTWTYCFMGINENNSLDDISIFPNPTNGMFTVQSSKFKIQGYKLYSVMGECLYEKTLNIEQETLNCILPSGLGRGIYFLKLTTENGITVRKIIKASCYLQ
ncbi:MAG: T9SS type A sorting domain-containing protein [Bacteroidetes bacterium]|nr:T9SS type A sorting domain-containing protein [Bacteroidota bacterium]